MSSLFRVQLPVTLIVLLALLPLNKTHAGAIEPGDKLPMPEIRWQDGDGKVHNLHDSTGKPRLLHFWAAWCIPCREELPDMLQWQSMNSDIKVIALSLDQRITQTKHFIQRQQLAMPALLLNEDDGDALGIPVVPYTIFVSADGKFTGHVAGIADWQDIDFTHQVYEHFKLNINPAASSGN